MPAFSAGLGVEAGRAHGQACPAKGCGPKSHEVGELVGDVTFRVPDWGQEMVGLEE